jgi:hypothetical protein
MTTIVVLVNERPESRAVCHEIYTETTDPAHRIITLAEELMIWLSSGCRNAPPQ